MCLELEAGREDAGRKMTEEKGKMLCTQQDISWMPDSKHAASLAGESRGFASVPGRAVFEPVPCVFGKVLGPPWREVMHPTTSCLTIGNKTRCLVWSCLPDQETSPQGAAWGNRSVRLGWGDVSGNPAVLCWASRTAQAVNG